MAYEEKATAHNPSVGADGGQPISINTNQSIADTPAEINDNFGFEEIAQQIRQFNSPGYMRTFSMSDLYENVYDSRPPIVDGLLYSGTYLFVGAPKVGKSFFMAQLAYHVSMGIPLWNYEVKKGAVLYLALEDTEKRLQERLFRMYGTDSAENLHFTIWVKQLGSGLDEQLQRFVTEHPDTKLIIIDTLQKVREAGGDKFIPDLGGYSVPEEFGAFILDNSLENEVIRPRATVFPMSSQTRKAPAFDSSNHTEGMYGGFVGQWLTEGETAEKQDAKLRLLTLTAQKLGCFTQASNELLADGVGFEEQLGDALINSVGWYMDYAFINGTGDGQPLGIINDPALIVIGKEASQAAATITYNNVVAMFSRLSPACFNSAIWLANPTVIPQLLTMSMTIGTGGVQIPVFKEESGRFTILGKEVVFTEKCPALGTKGDLVIADLTQYAIGLRKEISLDRSNVPGWTEDMTDYSAIMRVDGKGMWDKPIIPANGNTLSWCVALENRA